MSKTPSDVKKKDYFKPTEFQMLIFDFFDFLNAITLSIIFLTKNVIGIIY